MATFHPFPRLPAELRLRIWELAAEPRVVKVLGTSRYKFEAGSMVIEEVFHSPTPVPLMLHACAESRRHPLYKKVFDNEAKAEKYTWVSFVIDTIQCSERLLWISPVERQLIRRLRMEVYDADDFAENGTPILKKLRALKSLDILYGDGMDEWFGMYDWDYGVCPKKNVRLVSTTTGETWDEQKCRQAEKERNGETASEESEDQTD